MARGTQDNEDEDELTFVKLAAVTANVVRWLMKVDEEKKEQRQRNTGSGSEEKKQTEEHTDYVDQRLRELAAFERRARGVKDRTGR